jgi:hypothetical protein
MGKKNRVMVWFCEYFVFKMYVYIYVCNFWHMHILNQVTSNTFLR